MFKLLAFALALSACTDEPVRAVDHVDTGNTDCVAEYTKMFHDRSPECRAYAAAASAPICDEAGFDALSAHAFACATAARALADEAATGCVGKLAAHVCTQYVCAPTSSCETEAYYDEEAHACACR